ncbi:MAG TPA: hypothetical protein VEK79_10655 [Thermoanaerobaculia bacterium]|nr:hypothetical protein [Thermoanaerobaculia bacterium]
MIALLTCGIFLVVGMAVALYLRPSPNVIEFLSRAFLIGVGALGTFLFVLGVIGISMTRWLAWSVVAIALPLIWKRRDAIPRASGANAGLLLIVIPFAIALYGIWGLPFADYDGRVTWLPKATAIVHEQSIAGPAFHGERGLNLHNHYPLLLPLDVAAMMLIAGADNTDVARPLYLFIPFGFLVYAWQHGRRLIAAAAWLPQWIAAAEGGVSSGYSDLAAASFFGAALLAADEDDAGSTGMWLGFLILTKNEGIVLATAVIGALIVFRRIKWPVLIAPAVAVVTLTIWRASIPEAYEHRYHVLMRDLLNQLPRLDDAIRAFARHAFSIAEWGFVWPAIILACIWSFVRGRDRVTILALFAAACVYVLIYTTTSWNIDELARTSANRLLTHLVVPGLFVLGSAIRSDDEAAHHS